MPEIKKSTTRLAVLDEMMNNRSWTFEELLETINMRMDEPVTRRTLYRDINYLIEKGAPIHRPGKGDNRYYYERNFSLREIPLDPDEISSLKKAIEILKQVENFELISDVDAIIKKLENRIHTNVPAGSTIVQFEKHTSASGHEHINELFDAIQSRTPLRITYQSFQSDAAKEQVVHPYLLKELGTDGF